MLRLSGANPFIASLTDRNRLIIDLHMPILMPGDLFTVGFFTDYSDDVRGAAIVATLNDGRVNDGLGVVFDQMIPETLNLGTGPVVGRAMQFQIVPEPGTVGLLAMGAMGLLRGRRRAEIGRLGD